MKKHAYILRGSPASGKSTVTKILLQNLRGRVATLELDLFRWSIHLKPRSIVDIGNDEHLLAFSNFLSVLDNYCKNGSYTIVMEGLFAWTKPSPHGNMREIFQCLERHGFGHTAIRLEAPFEVLWARNSKRDYVVPREEFDELRNTVMDETGPEEQVLDVSTLTAEQVASTILKG